jgi:hypothetical protein
MWLRDEESLLSYNEYKEISVELKPRHKKRSEPKVEDNDPFADIKGKRCTLLLTIVDDASIWDEPEDDESNIRISNETKTIASATLNKLIERLTSEKDHGLFVDI